MDVDGREMGSSGSSQWNREHKGVEPEGAERERDREFPGTDVKGM